MDELTEIRRFRRRAELDAAARDGARDALRAAASAAAPRRPRALIAFASAAMLLLCAGTAYAVAREFLVGDPAPPEVKSEAAKINSDGRPLIPTTTARPQVRPEGTRLAASLQSSAGPVYLWRADGARGDATCLFVQIASAPQRDGGPNLGGGCSATADPIAVTASGTRTRAGWLALVYGSVDESVHRLAAQLEDRRVDVPLEGRYFLFEPPAAVDDEIPRVRLLGYDSGGREIAEHELGTPRAPANSCANDLADEEPVLEILTRRTGKPIRAYLVVRGGRRCQVLVTPGGTSSGTAGPTPRPREIPLGLTQIGAGESGMVLIWGQIGDAITQLELVFDDGRSERLPLTDNMTLYQVSPDDDAEGRRPTKLVGRDRSGNVIAERVLR